MLGTGLGWTSPAIPQIQSGDITHTMSNDEASWAGSFFALGGIIASQVCPNLLLIPNLIILDLIGI